MEEFLVGFEGSDPFHSTRACQTLATPDGACLSASPGTAQIAGTTFEGCRR